MPMYVYACDSCGHQFEIRQSFSDDPLDTCPECTGRIRRVIHPTGIIFKGSGWYITDSRTSSSAESAGTDTAASSSTSKSAEAVAADD